MRYKYLYISKSFPAEQKQFWEHISVRVFRSHKTEIGHQRRNHKVYVQVRVGTTAAHHTVNALTLYEQNIELRKTDGKIIPRT